MASGALTRSDWTIRLWLRLRSAAAIGLCTLLAACSGATYSGPEWSARVIDMETGAPIEGAIVVVRWELERYSGKFAGWLFLTEAVTDKDGIFHVPAWGPLAAPSESGMRTRMSPNVPSVHIFKSGYRLHGDSCCSDTSYLNDHWNYGSGPAIRDSWADGRVFALATFHGSLANYRDYLNTDFTLAGPSCGFITTPRIYAAAITEDRKFRTRIGWGIPHLSTEGLQENRNDAQCSETIQSAVERYLQ